MATEADLAHAGMFCDFAYASKVDATIARLGTGLTSPDSTEIVAGQPSPKGRGSLERRRLAPLSGLGDLPSALPCAVGVALLLVRWANPLRPVTFFSPNSF